MNELDRDCPASAVHLCVRQCPVSFRYCEARFQFVSNDDVSCRTVVLLQSVCVCLDLSIIIAKNSNMVQKLNRAVTQSSTSSNILMELVSGHEIEFCRL